MANNEIEVKLTVDEQKALKSLTNFANKIKGTAQTTKKESDNITNFVSRSFSSIGRIASGFVIGNTVFAGLNKLQQELSETVTNFIEFEKALIGVQKTTNLSDRDIQILGDRFLELGNKIPVATKDLLDIAQAAGALGVRGVSNLERFTETVARLGVATDVSGDEAAKALVRIINTSGDSVENIDKVGAALVGLGNNFATTESEIITVANELSRATTQFELGSANVLGLSAALKSLGIQAESGGSVIGRAFIEIDKSIRSGGKRLEILTKLTGLTGGQLRKTFAEDSTEVFTRFIEGLGKASDQGIVATDVLEQLGIKGIRVNKVIPPLVKRFDILRDSIEKSNGFYKDNLALLDESEKAFDTLGSQVEIFGNIVTNSIIKKFQPAGEALKEFLKEANRGLKENFGEASSVEDANRRIENLTNSIKELETATDFEGNLVPANPDTLRKLNEELDGLIKRRKELSEASVQDETGSLLLRRPEQTAGQIGGPLVNENDILDPLNNIEQKAREKFEEIQRNLKPVKDKSLGVSDPDRDAKDLEALTAQQEAIAAQIALANEEADALKAERRLMQEEMQLAERDQQDKIRDEDFKKFTEIEQAKLKNKFAVEKKKIELIKNAALRQAENAKLEEKINNERRQKEIQAQTQFNAKMDQLDQTRTNSSIGFAQATASALASITGQSNKVQLAIQKAASIAQILVDDGRARAGAFAATAAIPYPANLAAFGQMQAAITSNTALAIGTVAAQTIGELARFQEGGFVPGNSFTGDQTLIRANAGELVMNQSQQRNALQAFLNGGGQNNNMNEAIMGLTEAINNQPVVVSIDEREIARATRNADLDGFRVTS